MSDAAVAALSALGGALIGSLGGAAATILAYMQAKGTRESEERRHLWRLGLELGLKQWETQFAHVQKHGGTLSPPQVYAYFGGRFLHLVASGEMSPARYEQLDKKMGTFARAVQEFPGDAAGPR